MLWILPAAIFVFTRYPWTLQLYYAHFSVIGLALLTALVVGSLHQRLNAFGDRGHSFDSRRRSAGGVLKVWPGAFGATAVVLIGVWIGLAGWTIRSGISRRSSPALYESDLAKNAYDALSPHLLDSQYRRIVFLDLSDAMWASIYFGKMIPVFFPEVEAARDGRGGVETGAPPHTTGATLVVRQTGEKALTIVR